ncbi:hypothetical protein MTO96_003951 [Rhipicephalus appendiculatus]
MAAPSGPAGSGAVKKVTSATQEEKSSKKRAPEPKTREREHIERILEEREERHTGTSVFFRGDLTEKLRHVPKIAPLPTFSPRSPRIGPMSPAPPVSAASPDPPGPPVLSVLPGTSAAPTPMRVECVRRGEWIEETKWQNLFARCFNLSLKNHFHTVFKINLRNTENGSYYSVEMGLSFYRKMLRNVPSLETNEYLRRVLERIGEPAPRSEVVSELIQLDGIWASRINMKGAPTFPKSVAALLCGPFTTDVWGPRFAEHGAHNDTAVEANYFGLTCSFMEAVFLNASAEARPLYLLALVAAQVLTYDFQLAFFSRSKELLMDVCQNGALHLFGEMWLHAMSMFLVTQAAERAGHQKFHQFRRASAACCFETRVDER